MGYLIQGGTGTVNLNLALSMGNTAPQEDLGPVQEVYAESFGSGTNGIGAALAALASRGLLLDAGTPIFNDGYGAFGGGFYANGVCLGGPFLSSYGGGINGNLDAVLRSITQASGTPAWSIDSSGNISGNSLSVTGYPASAGMVLATEYHVLTADAVNCAIDGSIYGHLNGLYLAGFLSGITDVGGFLNTLAGVSGSGQGLSSADSPSFDLLTLSNLNLGLTGQSPSTMVVLCLDASGNAYGYGYMPGDGTACLGAAHIGANGTYTINIGQGTYGSDLGFDASGNLTAGNATLGNLTLQYQGGLMWMNTTAGVVWCDANILPNGSGWLTFSGGASGIEFDDSSNGISLGASSRLNMASGGQYSHGRLSLPDISHQSTVDQSLVANTAWATLDETNSLIVFSVLLSDGQTVKHGTVALS